MFFLQTRGLISADGISGASGNQVSNGSSILTGLTRAAAVIANDSATTGKSGKSVSSVPTSGTSVAAVIPNLAGHVAAGLVELAAAGTDASFGAKARVRVGAAAGSDAALDVAAAGVSGAAVGFDGHVAAVSNAVAGDAAGAGILGNVNGGGISVPKGASVASSAAAFADGDLAVHVVLPAATVISGAAVVGCQSIARRLDFLGGAAEALDGSHWGKQAEASKGNDHHGGGNGRNLHLGLRVGLVRKR